MQKNNETITPPLPDLDLCPVKGGEFIMGDDNSEYDDEKPAHSVHVAGFYMGKFQVTQRLWESVTGDNPSDFKGERRPVETVSWEDAQTFLDKLNARAEVQDFIRQLDPPGTKFRLPTEAEWEFAARGGIYSQGYTYAGSDRLKQVGWHDKNSDDQTHEVGLLLANELGLHDMSGNVWEWCQDWFSDKYYEECHKRGTVENPQGPDKGALRVLRGGSSFFSPVSCRSVRRANLEPEIRSRGLGFRLVLPFQAAGS
ncbi:MAG: formylglycine-generating enzyme family protein [Candidatus Electrothrix communis]|nr:MAG: formylglycine-generating enzyme family protein [Candidatus Electrothrix communis]